MSVFNMNTFSHKLKNAMSGIYCGWKIVEFNRHAKDLRIGQVSYVRDLD